MIDTLARHLAALSEAKRLIGLVLANNPDFVAWQRSADCSLEAALAGDRTFAAYRHLEAAIELLRPEPFVEAAAATAPVVATSTATSAAPTAGISAKVVLLQPRTSSNRQVVSNAATRAVDPVDPPADASDAAVAPSSNAPTAPAQPIVSAAIVADGIVYGPHLHDEAAVSIILPGQPASEPEPGRPGEPLHRTALWRTLGPPPVETEPARRRSWLSALFGRRIETSG